MSRNRVIISVDNGLSLSSYQTINQSNIWFFINSLVPGRFEWVLRQFYAILKLIVLTDVSLVKFSSGDCIGPGNGLMPDQAITRTNTIEYYQPVLTQIYVVIRLH